MFLDGMRDYQVELIEAVERRWAAGVQRPAIVLPTGMGKTHTFARLAMRWRARAEQEGVTNRRVLFLAHRDELLDGAISSLRGAAPGMRVGKVAAAANGTLSPYVVASVMTLAQERRRRQLAGVGLVIVDEAHHAAALSYRKILQHYGCEGGDTLALGVTATMSRGDKLALGDVWQEIVAGPSIAQGIEAGWLVRPRGLRVRVQGLDFSKIKRVGGDYAKQSLGDALEDADAPGAIVKAVREHVDDRPTIVFAPLVHTADAIRDALRADGFTAETVSGKTPKETRRFILREFKARRVQFLCNAMVFTEGTDLPLASCAIIARPTLHPGLYIQMVGRVLRPSPGKVDALVLDVVGASQKHALTAHIELFGTEDAFDHVREPCGCFPGDLRYCSCGRRRCLADCACGGGVSGECDCRRPEESVDLPEDEGTLTLGGALRADDVSWHNGEIVAEHVDLFHQSKSAWLRTDAGCWFLPAGERYLVLLPGQYGGFDVASVAKRSGDGWHWVKQRCESFADATGWAEANVTTKERLTASRGQSWRATRPTEKTVALARQLHIPVMPDMTGGEVSNKITVKLASRRIDPGLPPWVVG